MQKMPIATNAPLERPIYDAFDPQGLPISRPAKVIGELPSIEAQTAALIEAAAAISERIGVAPKGTAKLCDPFFLAFQDMNRGRAKHHKEAKTLLLPGSDVSLDYCTSYLRPNPAAPRPEKSLPQNASQA